MNRIREVAESQGRTLVWLGRQISLKRSAFNMRINADSFTPEQRIKLAEALGVLPTELFPEPEQEPLQS